MPIRRFSDKLLACQQTEFTRYLSSTLVLFALATPAFAQGFHFGVKVGVPITEYFEADPNIRSFDYSSATRRYTVGVSAEWRLRRGFGLELDALYKRMGYVGNTYFASSISGEQITETFDVKGNSWDFPIMAKYRFGQRLAPYVAGGFVLRHIGPVRARGVTTDRKLALVDNRITSVTVTTPIDSSEPPDLRKRTWPGLTVAGGIEFGRGWLRLLPEFRYTRWTSNISGPRAPLRFEPNQVEFLLGFLF